MGQYTRKENNQTSMCDYSRKWQLGTTKRHMGAMARINRNSIMEFDQQSTTEVRKTSWTGPAVIPVWIWRWVAVWWSTWKVVFNSGYGTSQEQHYWATFWSWLSLLRCRHEVFSMVEDGIWRGQSQQCDVVDSEFLPLFMTTSEAILRVSIDEGVPVFRQWLKV